MKQRNSILYVQYGNPLAYPPVLNSASILQSHGWKVRLSGTTSASQFGLSNGPNGDQDIDLIKTPSRKSWIKYFFVWYTLRTTQRILRSNANWIYVSDPMICPAVEAALRIVKKQVVYHEHDSFSEANDRKSRWIRKKRNLVAMKASVCVLPNEHRADVFQRETGVSMRPEVVWNCPSTSELSLASHYKRKACRSIQDPLQVVYCGTLNATRVPFTFIEALQIEPRMHLSLIGYETVGSVGYTARALELAEALGVGSRIRFLGQLPRQKVFETLGEYDVAIATIPINSPDINMVGMLGASNKSFDCLSCGTPMLISRIPEWERTFEESGVARSCDPSEKSSIVAAMRWFADHPEESQEMGRLALGKIKASWNYESQFNRVLTKMESR